MQAPPLCAGNGRVGHCGTTKKEEPHWRLLATQQYCRPATDLYFGFFEASPEASVISAKRDPLGPTHEFEVIGYSEV